MGQRVVCIDGWDVVGGTDGLNPMDLIDPQSPDALDDAEIVATVHLPGRVPAGFHGNWSRNQSSRSAD